MKPGGVLCAQGECLWLHADLIEQMVSEHGASFASVEYASIQVPTYPAGQIGALLARKADDGTSKDASCRIARRPVPDDMPCRYYTEAMHAAAFALPAFMQKRLGSSSAYQTKRRLSWEGP